MYYIYTNIKTQTMDLVLTFQVQAGAVPVNLSSSYLEEKLQKPLVIISTLIPFPFPKAKEDTRYSHSPEQLYKAECRLTGFKLS